jgi:hypothetical protein
MSHHPRSLVGRIKQTVSGVSVVLALGVFASPFAAAVDPVSSPTPSASASDGAAPSLTASAEPSVTPDGTESGSASLDVTTPDAATSPTPEASETASPSPQRLPSQRAKRVQAAAVVTTSGVLRDATTGAPIPNSCFAWRSTSVTETATNATNRVDDKGHWSFDSDDPGPFYIAFYVTANGNCSKSDLVLTGSENYRASWYQAQPFTGTNPSTALPPRGADQVTAGSDIVACLGTQDALPTECTIPDRTVSGRVVGFGPVPIYQACIVAIGANDKELGFAISDADGRWKMSGLPINYDFIVGVIPPFKTREGPCTGPAGSGPPPPPPPGALQPEFYDDTWVDLSDPTLRDNPFAWATDPNSPHPAVVMRNNQTGIDVCLTTETGRDIERGSCDPATPTPTVTPTVTDSDTDSSSTGSALAATGGPSLLTAALGAALLLAAVGLLARSRSIGRRSRSVRGRRT